jgi:hydrogenase nickel incorporation protein HypA/HybF
MHEFTVAKEILRLIEQTANANEGRRALAATVEFGELTAVDPETLRFAFEQVAAGGPAAGCRLDCERTPLLVECTVCGHQGPATLTNLTCARCGGTPLRVVSGRGMRLVSVDLED